MARQYKEADVNWVVFRDENYSEPSPSSPDSSEAEPSPSSHLPGIDTFPQVLILLKYDPIFRIHKTNVKKQGMLPLTFNNTAD